MPGLDQKGIGCGEFIGMLHTSCSVGTILVKDKVIRSKVNNNANTIRIGLIAQFIKVKTSVG